MDLVEEQDRPPSVRAKPFGRTRDHLPHLRHRRGDGRELFERCARHPGDDPCERRLSASRRPVQDGGADAILLDRKPQRRALAEDVRLADERLERLRPHAQRERRRLR